MVLSFFFLFALILFTIFYLKPATVETKEVQCHLVVLFLVFVVGWLPRYNHSLCQLSYVAITPHLYPPLSFFLFLSEIRKKMKKQKYLYE